MAILLAFDTTHRNASAAIVEGQQCLASIDSASWLARQESPDVRGTSTAIVSLIERLLDEAKLTGDQIDAIAFSNGPGTFTGVRVGIVTAKMLCYAWDKPAIVINSLHAAAVKLQQQRKLTLGDRIWSAVNAQRNEVFAAAYRITKNLEVEQTSEMRLYDERRLIDTLRRGDHVTGSGAKLFRKQIHQKTGIELPADQDARCDAMAVAWLAEIRLEQELFNDFYAVEPIYFRPSAAEEVRAAAASDDR